MSIGSVLIGLQAYANKTGVSTDDILIPLNIQPFEVLATSADGGPWASGMVYFAVVRLSDFDHVDCSVDAGAKTIAFETGVSTAFQAAESFLDRRDPSITEAMRSAGLSLRLFVEVRMDQDQMELEIPAQLLTACGRHRIGIYLLSNDF